MVEVKSADRATLQKIAVLSAAIVAATAVVGWIACRSFETSVGVHSDLAAGPFDYLSAGANALLPYGLMWSVGAGLLAVIASIGRALRGPLATIRTRIRATRSSADGATVATFITVAAVACFLAIIWRYSKIFSVMTGLNSGAPLSAAELSVLGSAERVLHREQFLSCAYLSFLLALAIWRWFPRLEQETADADRVRLLKWATIVVTALVIAAGTLQWRVVWERFEVVAFDNQRAFVIGSSSDELLLYYPYANLSKHRRVRKDAPTLVRTGAQARLFDR